MHFMEKKGGELRSSREEVFLRKVGIGATTAVAPQTSKLHSDC